MGFKAYNNNPKLSCHDTRYTAGKAAKIPPSLPPKFFAIKAAATTALPPKRKRRRTWNTSILIIIFCPCIEYLGDGSMPFLEN